jgi:hypothetical protein
MRRLLLLLMSATLSRSLHIPAWRAWTHALAPITSQRPETLEGFFSEPRGNLMFWKASAHVPSDRSLCLTWSHRRSCTRLVARRCDTCCCAKWRRAT